MATPRRRPVYNEHDEPVHDGCLEAESGALEAHGP